MKPPPHFKIAASFLTLTIATVCTRAHAPTLHRPASSRAVASASQCSGVTFRSVALAKGSIDGQDGWSSDPTAGFDQGVVELGDAACRGHGAWKIGTSVVSNGIANQPMSPAAPVSAGENGARSADGADTFEASFFLRTVSDEADGSNFTLSFSPTEGERHTYLRFVNDRDASGGFRVYALDGDARDQKHPAGSDLSRGNWHHFRVVNRNVDGDANDVVEVYVDGLLVSRHRSWEAEGAPKKSVTRTIFRMSTPARSVNAAFTAPQGFYVDDYIQKIYASSAPDRVLHEYRTGFETP